MSDRTIYASNDDQRIATMLYLYNFCEQVHSYLTAIAKMSPELNESSVPFRGHGNIRPIQCNATINTLEEIKTKLQCLCQIFHSDIYSLPLAFTILGYRSLFSVNRASEQISQLIDLIEDFRVDCMTSSPLVLKQRKSISTEFDQLLSLLYSIPLQFIDIKTEAQQITLELILQDQQDLIRNSA